MELDLDIVREAKEKQEATKGRGRSWFVVGEVVALRGMLFRVKGVKPDEIRLKLQWRTKYVPPEK